MELGLLIACGIISTLALLLSMISIIMIVAKEKATHTVQMVPIDEEMDKVNEEFLATTQAAIDKQNKLHREDVEEDMPEFSLNEDDMEKFSI